MWSFYLRPIFQINSYFQESLNNSRRIWIIFLQVQFTLLLNSSKTFIRTCRYFYFSTYFPHSCYAKHITALVMLDNRSERYRALYKWITFVAGNIYISTITGAWIIPIFSQPSQGRLWANAPTKLNFNHTTPSWKSWHDEMVHKLARACPQNRKQEVL